MSLEQGTVPPRLTFWRSLSLLIAVSWRRRAASRRVSQVRHADDRADPGGATDEEVETATDDGDLARSAASAGCLGALVAVLFGVFTHGAGAYVVLQAVKASQRVAIEQQGRLVVDQWFLDSLTDALHVSRSQAALDAGVKDDLAAEAEARANREGTTAAAQQTLLRDAMHAGGAAAFVTEDDVPGFNGLAMFGLPALFGSLALLAWSATLVMQGEGLELDVQGRKFPVLEWLFTHPISRPAIFFAEMLKPLATNPVYWSAPLFPGLLYGMLYGPLQGLAAMVVVGVPISVSTACLGKALELCVTLRAPPGWQGALLGVMNWVGFSAGMAMFLLAVTAIDSVVHDASGLLAPLAELPWPWLAIFLGRFTPYHSSFLFGMLTAWAAAAATILGSLWLAVWSASAGLDAATRTRAATSARPSRTWYRLGFAEHPLYRREIAWFLRDRGALAQAILLPLTLAAFQLFNFRGLVRTAPDDWTFVAAGTVVLGTYLLINLGARSLAADRPVIWLALTWPRRVESLLVPRMRAWTALSTFVVWLVLAFSAWREPSATPAIAFIALLWVVFAASMARKVVSRSRTTDDANETRIGWAANNWAVTLGTLAFAIGIVSRQWHLVAVAVLFSWLTAYGMWRRFRRRLPAPLDPWSEHRPPPPVLAHAMIALSGLLDGGALATGFVVALFHTDPAAAFPIAYGLSAAVVSVVAWQMLLRRGVRLHDVLIWPGKQQGRPSNLVAALIGLGIGVGLGCLGCLYGEVLRQTMPDASYWAFSVIVPAGDWRMHLTSAVVTALIAPVAQEYLFRGLLYRSLERIATGWAAVLGSAALYAVYQPVGAWLAAFAVGTTAALVYKRTGRLWVAVLMHVVYGAVVLGWMVSTAG